MAKAAKTQTTIKEAIKLELIKEAKKVISICIYINTSQSKDIYSFNEFTYFQAVKSDGK